MGHRWFWPELIACGCVLLHTGASRAQTSAPTESHAAAQALFDEARRLMAQGDHEHACPKLEESQRLDPGVGTQFNLAVCYEGIGRTASAWSLFLEVAAAASREAEHARERVARERAAVLAAKLSRLRIVVPKRARSDGLRVERGSAVVGPAQWGVALPTDPGTYTITANAPGKQPWHVDVTVPSNGDTYTVTLAPLPDAPVPKAQPTHERSWLAALDTQRKVALGLGAGALVAAGVASVFSVLALNANSASNDNCDKNSCNEAGLAKRNQARAHGDRATVAFVAGGALGAAAIALYLTGHSEEHPQTRSLSWAPAISPTGATLLARGQF